MSFQLGRWLPLELVDAAGASGPAAEAMCAGVDAAGASSPVAEAMSCKSCKHHCLVIVAFPKQLFKNDAYECWLLSVGY